MRPFQVLPAWLDVIANMYTSRKMSTKRPPIVLQLTLLVLFCYLMNQSPFRHVVKLLELSYAAGPDTPDVPSPSKQYDRGIWDAAYIVFYGAVFYSLRLVLMKDMFMKVAKYFGVLKPAKQPRFAEQLFSFCYFCASTSYGLAVLHGTDMWRLNFSNLVHRATPFPLTEGLKRYYLLQAAYWLHEAAALMRGSEKPRKDHNQLIFHHVLTLILVGASYMFGYMDYGLLVFITHDACDVLLSLAKMLNYLSSSFTTAAWVTFLAVWIYCRHYVNIRIIISAILRTIQAQKKGQVDHIFYGCIVCLVCLQGLNLLWLGLILRGMFRLALAEGTTDDARSDDGSEDGSEAGRSSMDLAQFDDAEKA